MVPEIDYNMTLFFVDDKDYHYNVYIHDAVQLDLQNQLRDKMLRKFYDRESFQCDLMETPDGVALPLHRPLIEDYQDLHLAFWEFMDLSVGQLRATGCSQLYPKNLLSIIDPILGINIEKIPTYSFPDFERHLFMSSDADAVHVMIVDAFFYNVEIDVTPRYLLRWPREYVDIGLKGEKIKYRDYDTYIPRGTVVVIWNAKSMVGP